jgi:hypothetical protein
MNTTSVRPHLFHRIESWGLVIAGVWFVTAPVWLGFATTPMGFTNIGIGAAIIAGDLLLPPCPAHWSNTPYILLGFAPSFAMMVFQPVSGPILISNLMGSLLTVLFSLRPRGAKHGTGL